MKFHPSPDLLIRYTAGTVSPAMSFLIATHIKHCDVCQIQQNKLEAFGGVSIESCSDTDMKASSFDAVMRQIEASNNEPAVSEENIHSDAVIASDYQPILNRVANNNYEGISWQHVSKSISHAELAIDDSSNKIELLQFKPGAKIPSHTHKGNEYTVILEGSYTDEMGQFERGDFIHLTGNHHHRPVAGKEGCVCIAVTDAPMHFTGPIGPILNFFSRVA